jgi:hypothetical protein
MTRHGKFEAVAVLHRSAHTSVWSARLAASTATVPNHCLKRVELSDHELADHDPTTAEDLLVGAALQQAMGDKSPGWAPVFELGSDGTDAFYVTRLYPRSAQSMIDGRVRVASADLRTILLAVVDALIDLDALYHRPHANLKPSNVLIGEQLRSGQVCLTDPGALARNVPSLTRAPDPKAVGQLLYALVTHRPHTGARWPLAYGDAWRALGSSGRQWFALCESLVNPFGDQLPNLEQLRARILAVQTTRRRMPRSLVAVPVLAAAAAAAYVGRDRIKQWYRAADRQVALFTEPSKPARKPTPPARPVGTSAFPSPASVAAHPPANPSPSAPAGHPAAPPAAGPDLSATLAGLSVAPLVPTPPGQSVPAQGSTSDVPPVAPPPTVHDRPGSPVLAAPAVPTTAPAPDADADAGNNTANRRALELVRDWSPPDFRSDAAQAAFEDGRKQFIAAHDKDDAATTLGKWEGVSARLRLAGDAYPPVDVATTAGWPVAVADQVAARREQLLPRAVGSAFDQTAFDPAPYRKLIAGVKQAVEAAKVARKAMAGGSVPAARSAAGDFQTAVRQVSAVDPAVADALSAAAADLNRLGAVDASTDRDKLLATADDESAPLAVRTDAWMRAASGAGKPWPADFAAAATDHARGVELAGLLHDQESSAAEHDVLAEADRRLSTFLGSLRDPTAVAASAAQAKDPQYADLLARCPAWFRFDAALATARATSPAAVKPGQRQQLLDVATTANVPASRDVADLLRAGDRQATGTLADAGPAAVGGWRLHAGSGRDRCTFDATVGSPVTLEFLRVHVPATDTSADSAGLDCYLCTTDVPVALAAHLLANDPPAIAAARDLAGPAPADGGPMVWAFSDNPANPVVPDGNAYRRCFAVPPSAQLPVQRVTPQLALFLARRAGCRLPSTAEWRAAFNAAQRSDDPVARGFATVGWKVRTANDYTALLANPTRDATARPDAGAFLPAGISAADGVWSATDLAKLGGRAAGDVSAPPPAWPLSSLESADPFGFRAVGGTDDYAGVFHDLVGNVAQLTLDVPPTLAEQVDPKSGSAAADVRSWFTPQRLSAVSVVGASAVSPPAVDPTKPYPLPPGATSFADVGFRLAFTDPAARPAEAWTALRRMPYATAP